MAKKSPDTQQGRPGLHESEHQSTALEKDKLHVRVANAKHVVEIQLLLLAALRLRRLFEVTLCAHINDDFLAVEAFFKTAERTFHGLAFADFYFE